MNRVPRNLRRKLNKRLLAQESAFHSMGDTAVGDSSRPHTFIDNGANILAVAHLDTAYKVLNPVWQNQRVISPQLDDRLGVWVLLDLLPAMGGTKFDVLFTTDEEVGASTASDFVASKDYNWIFSFDRRGNQVVMYDYEDQHTASLVERHGWEVGNGSFSDISYLSHLGVKGFNFGVGYYKEHTADCNAYLPDTLSNVKRFISFFDAHKDEKLVHTPKPKRSKSSWADYRYGSWDRDFYLPPSKSSRHGYPLDCAYCWAQIDLDWSFCPYCGEPIGCDTKNDFDDDDDDTVLDADWIIRS